MVGLGPVSVMALVTTVGGLVGDVGLVGLVRLVCDVGTKLVRVQVLDDDTHCLRLSSHSKPAAHGRLSVMTKPLHEA